MAHGNLYEHTWIDKKNCGTNLGFIKKCLRLQSWRTHTLGYLDACLRCEPLSSTSPIQPSPPPLSGSFTRITRWLTVSLFLIKLLWKRGKSRWGRSWWSDICAGEKYHHSVCSALCLGGLCCQYRRQTDGPRAARCPCTMVKKQKHSVGPLSASAHQENARLPIQPC